MPRLDSPALTAYVHVNEWRDWKIRRQSEDTLVLETENISVLFYGQDGVRELLEELLRQHKELTDEQRD